jgi:hypothetical protein
LAAGAVILLDVSIVRMIIDQAGTRRFSVTTGTITHSEVIVNRGGKGGNSYVPHIRYRFEALGRTFDQSQISFTGWSARMHSDPYIAGRYPVGSEVPIYYDPGDPTRAVLVRGISGGDLNPLFFLWLLTTGAVALMVVLLDQFPARGRRGTLVGGIRVWEDGDLIRARLRSPAKGILIGLGAGAVLSVPLLVVTAFGPWAASIEAVTLTLFTLPVVATAVSFVKVRAIESGKHDLVIDPVHGIVRFPWRSSRFEAPISSVRSVEAVPGRLPRKGRPAWIVDLSVEGGPFRPSGLVNCGSEANAKDFAHWLRHQVGIVET